jgi:hypothetical protein
MEAVKKQKTTKNHKSRLMKRDLECIAFVETFHIARTSTLATLFYNGNTKIAQRRLAIIAKHNQLKRAQFDAHAEFLYYSKTPTQLSHCLTRTDFIAYLSKEVKKIIDWEFPFECGKVRPDARLRYMNHMGAVKDALLEIQLTGAPDIEKYSDLKRGSDWVSRFETFPKLLIVCDENYAGLGLDIVRYKTTDIAKRR